MATRRQHPTRRVVLVLGAALALVAVSAAPASLSGQTAASSARTAPLERYERGALAPARARANSQSWDDAIGDSGTAPDVRRIEITNADNGTIAFLITFANRTTLQGDDLVNVLVDTDLATEGANRSGQDGVDRILVGDASGWGVLKWNGSDFAPVDPPPPSASATNKDGTLGFRIDVKDFDNPTTIGFRVIASGQPSGRVEEIAPDSILGPNTLTVYELTPDSESPGVELNGTITTSPARAGKLFIATLHFTRSDAANPTSGPLTGKTTACSAHIAVKPLPLASKASGGATVRCSWRLPATSRHKTVKGTVGVRFSSNGASAQLSFAKKIG